MKSFLKNLLSASSSEVHSPYGFALLTMLLATPVVVIAMVILARNYLVMGRALDSPGVQLILGLLTAATGGFGVSMFSRSTFSQFTSMGMGMGEQPYVPPGPPPGRAPPLP